MNKQKLLKMLAESGYNIGFGAKINLSTFEIIEKAPGWLGFISFVVGILALFIPSLSDDKIIASLLLIFSLITMNIAYYQQDKDKYSKSGSTLTQYFHKLREMYYTVQSTDEPFDFSEIIEEHRNLVAKASEDTISKQIFSSDWLAHIKFFGQHQIGWMDEQLKFRFFKDKIPASFKIVVYAAAIVLFVWKFKDMLEFIQTFCKG